MAASSSHTTICTNCGGWFKEGDRNDWFCSSKCRTEYKEKQAAQDASIQKEVEATKTETKETPS